MATDLVTINNVNCTISFGHFHDLFYVTTAKVRENLSISKESIWYPACVCVPLNTRKIYNGN